MRDLELAKVKNVSPKTIKLVFWLSKASINFPHILHLIQEKIDTIDSIVLIVPKKWCHKIMNTCVILHYWKIKQ